MNVTDAIICAPGAFMPSSSPAKRGRDDAGLAGPAHEQYFGKAPARAAIRQRTQKHRRRPRHQHQDGDDRHAAEPVSAHQGEIDLGAEQDENEQAHDEGRGQHKFVELLRFARLHPEAERLLVAEHDAEHEYRHEAAGLQPSAAK